MGTGHDHGDEDYLERSQNWPGGPKHVLPAPTPDATMQEANDGCVRWIYLKANDQLIEGPWYLPRLKLDYQNDTTP